MGRNDLMIQSDVRRAAAGDLPPAVVLVAHGSASEDANGTSLGILADRLRTRPGMGAVEVAFLHGSPNLPDALERLAVEREIRIAPMFAAEGYYTTTVIPALIAAAVTRRPRQSFRQLLPIGTHPGYVSSLARRLKRLALSADIDLASTALLAIGHGSRHPKASGREATAGLAQSLRDEFRSSDALYLDREPRAASWPSRIEAQSVLVAPVFFSDARHLRHDVPALFGLGCRVPGTYDSISGPSASHGKTIWYAEMPAVTACIADVVVDLACADLYPPADRSLKVGDA